MSGTWTFDASKLAPLAAAWGKHPICLKGIFKAPLLSEDEFLDTLRGVGDYVRAMPRGASSYDLGHSHYFNPDVFENIPVAIVDDPYPTASDRNLHAYYERVHAQLGTDFLVAGLDLEMHSLALRTRLMIFLAPLFEIVGHPPWMTHCNGFFGRYRSTPTGVHRDTSHVMTVPIFGTKRLRLWPEDFEKIAPEILNKPRSYYQRYLEHSTLLEGEVGDLMYHPVTAWHVAENDEVTASLTIPWDLQDNWWRDELSVPRWLAAAISERVGDGPAAPKADDRLPAPVRGAIDRFAAAQRGPGFVDHIWKRWLERTSRLSFRELPPRPAATLHPETSYVAEQGTVVEWIRSHAGGVVCAMNGHSFELGYFEGIGRVLERIASPQAWTLGELERAFAGDGIEAQQIRSVAQECVRRGVATPVSP